MLLVLWLFTTGSSKFSCKVAERAGFELFEKRYPISQTSMISAFEKGGEL